MLQASNAISAGQKRESQLLTAKTQRPMSSAYRFACSLLPVSSLLQNLSSSLGKALTDIGQYVVLNSRRAGVVQSEFNDSPF